MSNTRSLWVNSNSGDPPLISVVIPARNRQDYLDNAVGSVIGQTVEARIEIIVVDDGSTPKLSSPHIADHTRTVRVIRSKHVRGPAVSRNIGMSLARGKYIAFLDSDDYWQSDFLEKMIRTIRREGTLGACCMSRKIYTKNRSHPFLTVSTFMRRLRSVIKDNLFLLITYMNGGRLPVDLPYLTQLSHMLFERKTIADIIFYPEMILCEDWLFVSDVLKIGEVSIITDKLVNFRISSSGYALQKINRVDKRRLYQRLLCEMMKTSGPTPFVCLFYFYTLTI